MWSVREPSHTLGIEAGGLDSNKMCEDASKMCEDAQDLSYFGRADGQCEKFSILNLRCRGLHAWVEIDQSHLLP